MKHNESDSMKKTAIYTRVQDSPKVYDDINLQIEQCRKYIIRCNQEIKIYNGLWFSKPSVGETDRVKTFIL